MGQHTTDTKLTKNFLVSELACKHCGLCLMRDSFMNRLQALREAFGGPIEVTSGYRCPSHNKSIGGAKKSLHTQGRAADIRARDMGRLLILAKQFFPVAVKGPGFIHVDDREVPTTWEY